MLKGGGEAPRALSGRLVAATWWLYGFLLIAFYTANLAAFLTVTRLETSITSLDDLSKQNSIAFGPTNGSSALVYFTRMKQIEEDFYDIWKGMSLNDSLDPVSRAKLAVWDYPVSDEFTKLLEMMKNNGIAASQEDAMRRVMEGNYAFIDDATANRYQTLISCDVEIVGEEFSRKPFAFAVQQGSPLRTRISTAILELSNERFIEQLDAKWWHNNEHKKQCETIEKESGGITIQNVGGVFLVVAIGTALSLICLAVEWYWYKIKPAREAKLYDMNTSIGQIPAVGGSKSSKSNTVNTDSDHQNIDGFKAYQTSSAKSKADDDRRDIEGFNTYQMAVSSIETTNEQIVGSDWIRDSHVVVDQENSEQFLEKL